MIDIGYNSLNSVMLLQTLFVIQIMYLIQVIVVLSLWMFNKCTDDRLGLKNFVSKIVNSTFFGPLIDLYIQGYFEFLISTYLASQF